jgi:hypothetical protein
MSTAPKNPEGFATAKRKLLAALASGDYQFEVRAGIDVKNLLATGQMTASALQLIVKQSNGLEHSTSPHHGDASITVHVLKTGGWYIKFYFLDPSTFFISVHQ